MHKLLSMRNTLEVSTPEGFSWKHYGAYEVYDVFLDTLVLKRKSFISKNEQRLDCESALKDIRKRFVEGFDAGAKNFDQKARRQFKTASDNTKLFFANAEYLWAMPSSRMKVKSKRGFALRWFDSDLIKDTSNVYFNGDDGIGHPGSWYQTNKYFELLAVFRILSNLFQDNSLRTIAQVKKRIEDLCYEGLYGEPKPHGGFKVKNKCAVQSALLHLSAPDRYEMTFSNSHKDAIVRVFSHVIEDRSDIQCREKKMRLIRARVYEDYGASADPFKKYRWFFYVGDVEKIWLNKKNITEQRNASIKNQLDHEENSIDIDEKEGVRIKATGYRIYRSAKAASKAKTRDNHTCRACGFFYEKKIVQVHHLDPISERVPRKTKAQDLVTLCPNCHYIAHYLLRKSPRFKKESTLIKELKKVTLKLPTQIA